MQSGRNNGSYRILNGKIPSTYTHKHSLRARCVTSMALFDATALFTFHLSFHSFTLQMLRPSHTTAFESTNKKFYAWFFHLQWTVSISTPRNELEDRWSCHTDFINLLIANRALCELIHRRMPIAVQNTVNLPRLAMNKQIDHISMMHWHFIWRKKKAFYSSYIYLKYWNEWTRHFFIIWINEIVAL